MKPSQNNGQWAITQNNLANVYRDRTKGEIENNIEAAIHASEQALQVYTFDTFPEQWAGCHHNLAISYSNRTQGNLTENLEAAISFYKKALQVRTRDAFPEQWAETQNSLANVYYNRIQGNPVDNIALAVTAYEGVREVFCKFDTFPNRCRSVCHRIGNLHFKEQNWEAATDAYTDALVSAEALYQSCILLYSKVSELSETIGIYNRMAYASAHAGNLITALTTIEQSHARGLTESLDRDRTNLDQLRQQDSDLYSQYKDLTNQIRNLEAIQRDRMTSRDRNSVTPEALRDNATALRQKLDTLIQEIRQVPGYEQFLTLPTFEEIQGAVKNNRPLVYLVTTSKGSLALILQLDKIEPVWLNHLTESQLRGILYGSAEDPELSRWFGVYQDFCDNSKKHYLKWCEEIDTTTRQLWELLMAPVIEKLKAMGCDRATLVPTGLLSLLPLHAAWTEAPTKPTGRRYALDDIHFTYAPNAKSLIAAKAIADRIQPTNILAIDNPTQDLPNSSREINAAIASFPQSTVLRHGEATVAAVQSQLAEASIVHFSCHGTANLNEPLNSGLLMSDGLLTLKDIFGLNLAEDNQGIRLAILSACETGMIGLENADEAVSLPTGLLQAGVAAVIASLWSVSDLSTMLLLTKFYDLWREQNIPADQALRQAQIWLRDTTNEEKIAEFKTFLPAFTGTRMSPETAQQLYDELAWEARNDRSFAHPFHWAAFSYTGV